MMDAHSRVGRGRMADFSHSAGWLEDRGERARLKLDPASGFKSLSAHYYLTRQVSKAERQVKSKLLIELTQSRDSLICQEISDEPCRRFPKSESWRAFEMIGFTSSYAPRSLP